MYVITYRDVMGRLSISRKVSTVAEFNFCKDMLLLQIV